MSWKKSYTLECFIDSLWYTMFGIAEPIKIDKLSCDLNGVVGGIHSKMHTLSTVREEHVVDKGSFVLNRRQVTVTCQEECKQIASVLGIPEVLPEDMMSNIHLNGIFDLTTTYPGSFINFFDAQNQRRQLVIMITGVNDPCYIPKDRIEARYHPGAANGFEKVAYSRRGLIAMIYRPGFVKVGDKAVITIPRIFFRES